MKTDEILDQIEQMFPDAKCELVHHSAYELLVAVMLSAQTTDISVNKVTPQLFERFPTVEFLANASLSEVEGCIRQIGLYRNKAKNLIAMAQKVVNDYQGVIPNTMEELTSLAGVGRKTANVVLSEWFHVPSLAVDTHVERVSKRLGLVKMNASVLETEQVLKRKIKKDRWISAHHLFIFFGRYHCKAIHPACEDCPLLSQCKYQKHTMKS